MTTHDLITSYKGQPPAPHALIADLKKTGVNLAVNGNGHLYSTSGGLSTAVAALIKPIETELIKVLTTPVEPAPAVAAKSPAQPEVKA